MRGQDLGKKYLEVPPPAFLTPVHWVPAEKLWLVLCAQVNTVACAEHCRGSKGAPSQATGWTCWHEEGGRERMVWVILAAAPRKFGSVALRNPDCCEGQPPAPGVICQAY